MKDGQSFYGRPLFLLRENVHENFRFSTIYFFH